MTPYYQDNLVALYHGDCVEILPCIDSGSRVLTDPPYGFGTYETDVTPDPNLLAGLVTGHRTLAMFGYAEKLVGWCVGQQLIPTEWVTWWPTNTIGGARRATLLPRECEHIAIFGDVPGGKRLFRPRSENAKMRTRALTRGNDPDQARLGDVWRDASPGSGFKWHLRQHPNEKPLSVMGKLVELCSELGDTVLDPFCGSGTTLVAAKAAGRKAIGVELVEEFCEVAALRCSQEVLAFT